MLIDRYIWSFYLSFKPFISHNLQSNNGSLAQRWHKMVALLINVSSVDVFSRHTVVILHVSSEAKTKTGWNVFHFLTSNPQQEPEWSSEHYSSLPWYSRQAIHDKNIRQEYDKNIADCSFILLIFIFFISRRFDDYILHS